MRELKGFSLFTEGKSKSTSDRRSQVPRRTKIFLTTVLCYNVYMKNHLRTDFYIILTSIFLFVPIIIYFNVRPLTSALFFFIIPTTYLLFRSKKPLNRVLSGALLIGSGFGLIFNILASANNVWNEVGNQLVFNYRIFGFLPADEPVWFFF